MITSLDRGGAEAHVYQLATLQKNRGYDVSILYFKGNGYWKKKLENFGVDIYYFKFEIYFNILNYFFLIKLIKKLIKEKKISIIHCHLSFSEVIGSIIKFLLRDKIKLIISKHLDSFLFEGSRGQDKLLKGIFFEKIIFRLSDRVICISDNVKKYFTGFHQYNKKFHTIYYGVNIPKVNIKVRNILKKKHSINKNEIVISNIARHVNQKNLFFLLDVMEDVLFKRKLKFKLIMIGNGPLNDKLKRVSNYSNINQSIEWVNFTENINEYLNLSDIFVLTSDYEGLGLVLLEAMSAEVPIIASNKSAIPEVIKNKYNGLLYSHNNKMEFIECLEYLLKNKKIKKKLTNNGKKILQEKFNPYLMLKKTENIYKLKT